MIRNDFYCSVLSRNASEAKFGTASTGDVWLLIEYPRPWESKILHENRRLEPIKQFLDDTLASIPRSRVLFIKHEHRPARELSFFIVSCRERDPFTVGFTPDCYEDILRIDVAAVARGDSLDGGAIVKEPLYLVCTHGRRDKCCAKFGFPLYNSLRTELGDSVWQSSHVGGDRFAANLVCFPQGLFFAHVTEDGGRAIAGAHGIGNLILDDYRGRACFSPPVQAGEFFIRCESGIKKIDGLRHAGSRRLAQNHWRVRFVAEETQEMHEATVSGSLSVFQNFTTCHSTEEKPVVQFALDDYSVVKAATPVEA